MKAGVRYSLFVFFFFLFSFELAAQEKLTPEEKALHEKLVQLLFNFDAVAWEHLKTELRHKNFPVYSLAHEAIREAIVTNRIEESYVFSESDGPDVVEARFANHEKMRRELGWNS